jgi:MFS family permease
MSAKAIGKTLVSSFQAFDNRNFRIYIGGQTLSLIGTWMQATAQSWVVWQLTHSPAALGLVAMLSSLPNLVGSPWASVWADRLDRRKVLIFTQAVSMLLAFVLAMLVQTGTVQLWHVYALSLALGLVSALDLPAQNAFLGDLSGVQMLKQSFVWNASAIQVGRMVGPSIAGWLIGTLGVTSSFWVNGISFLGVIATLVAVRADQKRQPATGSPLDDFREGVAFMRKDPRIQDLMILTAFIWLFGFANTQIIPAIATDYLHGGPEVLGLLMSAFGAGALVSSLFMVPLVQAVPRTGFALSLAVIWAGLWFTLFSFSRWLPLSLISMFFAAIAQPVVMAVSKPMLQMLAPRQMAARLMGVHIMVSFGLQPISALVTGYTAQVLGSPVAVRANGLLMVAGALLLLVVHPELIRWEPEIG